MAGKVVLDGDHAVTLAEFLRDVVSSNVRRVDDSVLQPVRGGSSLLPDSGVHGHLVVHKDFNWHVLFTTCLTINQLGVVHEPDSHDEFLALASLVGVVRHVVGGGEVTGGVGL